MNNLISNKFRSQLIKIAWITLAWTIISVFQFLNAYQALLDMNCDLGGKDPMIYFGSSLVTGLFAGIIGGYGVVSSWEKWLRTRSYGWALLSIFISYTIIYVIVSLATGLFRHSAELGVSPFTLEVWRLIGNDFFQVGDYYSYFVWLVIVLSTLIFLQVNDKYGPGTFINLLRGKYFRPRREERIFMFLDLRSSTTIAEKLEEERYFNFLKDVFKHATPAILESRGEIYQYVGDEIVVSWPVYLGAKDANCLTCFFEIQKGLNEKSSYYQEVYGVLPEFKAGLHYGHVMAGEIGVVKKDIAFSGDVLNTTSRIQEKCNELGVDILISQFLIDKLALGSKLFTPKKIGDMLLRGKHQQVSLFTV